MSDDRELTPGFLPAAAMTDMRPVAIGAVDLEPPPRVSLMTERPSKDCGALLLVRLHGDPLGAVYLEEWEDDTPSDRLVQSVESQLGERIARHRLRFGCEPGAAGCPRSAKPGVRGSAAVIISTVGRTDMLARCLRSLECGPRDDLEVIVVDNRPAARTRDLVGRWDGSGLPVRYVAEPRRGLSVARNRGVAEARTEFVAFTDDDVVVDRDWLRWLLAPFADSKVTATTGMVLPLRLGSSAQKRFEQYAGFCKGFDRRSFDLHDHRADDRLLYPYWGGIFGAGNSMAFRRAELVAAGGFDPALGAGSIAESGEDMDAMSKTILRGGELVYEPRSLCWHEHRSGEAELRAQLFSYGVGLTAMLTKALTHDARFPVAVLRSVPVAWRLRSRAAARAGAAGALPPEWARIERHGMARGPILYARSVASARRRGLHEVIKGG